MGETESLVAEYAAHLLSGDVEKAVSRTREIIASGVEPLDFFRTIFTPSMEAIGERFGRLEIFLPELMSAADTALAVSEEVLKPAIRELQSSVSLTHGKIVLGSVKGDLHTIGKSMVALMLNVNGFEVLDLGVDVAPKEFIERALEMDADIVGLSSLMTTSMPYMKEVIDLRNGLGHQEKFFVIIGGAPITAEYCEKIGADAFGRDAVEAVKTCIQLMKSRSDGQSPGGSRS